VLKNWRLGLVLIVVLLGYLFGGLMFHSERSISGLVLFFASLLFHIYAYWRWPPDGQRGRQP
jgi:nicotinamide riboside transporter PnuC